MFNRHPYYLGAILKQGNKVCVHRNEPSTEESKRAERAKNDEKKICLKEDAIFK